MSSDYANVARGYGGILMDAIFAHYLKYGRRPRGFTLHPTVKPKLLDELHKTKKSLYFVDGRNCAPDSFAEVPIQWGGDIGAAWVLTCVNEFVEL